MSSETIPVQVFREILLLPLSLETLEDSECLKNWLVALQKDRNSAWEEQQGALLAHAPPSRVFEASTLCPSYPDQDAGHVFFREPPNRSDRERPGYRAAAECADQYKRRWLYGEAAYFHSFVQRFLFGGPRGDRYAVNRSAASDRVRLLRRKDIGALRVEMGLGGAEAFRVELRAERCDLYVMERTGIACLLVEVAATESTRVQALKQTPDASLHSVLLGGRHYVEAGCPRGFTLAEALALHDGLRRLYPPWLDECGSREKYNIAYFPGRVQALRADGAPEPKETLFDGRAHKTALDDLVDYGEAPVAPWWEALLDPLALSREKKNRTGRGSPRWRQVVDDRMPTMVFLAVQDSGVIERADLIRLCFADRSGKGLPYDEDFLADFEKRHAYNRFEHHGTLYFVSSYSFVTVCGTGETSFPPKKFSFALDVLQEHMRRHYTHMFLITHLQRAALLMFSRFLSDAVHDVEGRAGDPLYRSRIIDIRHRLLEFTQRYWFSNVSNQEQARELFALMQEHAGTHSLYEEVLAESKFAREELDLVAQDRQQAGTMGLSALLAFFVVLAAPIGVAQGLGAIVPDFKMSASFYFASLAAACVTAAAMIALVAAIQLEGRVWRGLGAMIWPWRWPRRRMRHRRALYRMQIVLWFGFLAILLLGAGFSKLSLDCAWLRGLGFPAQHAPGHADDSQHDLWLHGLGFPAQDDPPDIAD